jgi:DNA-directed RNA polymerase specialized sigma24 family protein
VNPEPANQPTPTFLHRAAAAAGLAAFAIVAIGVAALLFAATGMVAIEVVARLLGRDGVLDVERFHAVLRIGVVSTVAVALTAAIAKARGNIRRRSPRDERTRAGISGWAWSVATAVLAVAFMLVVPSAWREGPGSHSVLAGAVAVAAASWAVALAGVLLVRLLRVALRKGWSAARRSAFLSGASFAGGLGTLALSVALVHGVPSTRSRPLDRRGECDVGAEECFRRVLVAKSEEANASADAFTPASLQAADANAPDWAKCIEDVYRDNALLIEARRLAASIVQESDANDVVHDTILAVCQKSPENLRNYFLKAVSNHARTYRENPLRRPGRSCPLEDAPVQACFRTPELELENWQALERAMCVLDADDRRLIMMTAGGASADEIATHLGSNAAAVRKRKQRAFEKLRQEYTRLCK